MACLTKVLPKFSGIRAQLYQPLLETLAWANNPSAPNPNAAEQLLNEPGGETLEPELPHVAAKAQRMLRRLETTGFASYA